MFVPNVPKCHDIHVNINIQYCLVCDLLPSGFGDTTVQPRETNLLFQTGLSVYHHIYIEVMS